MFPGRTKTLASSLGNIYPWSDWDAAASLRSIDPWLDTSIWALCTSFQGQEGAPSGDRMAEGEDLRGVGGGVGGLKGAGGKYRKSLNLPEQKKLTCERMMHVCRVQSYLRSHVMNVGYLGVTRIEVVTSWRNVYLFCCNSMSSQFLISTTICLVE